jgi:hypothetical protein
MEVIPGIGLAGMVVGEAAQQTLNQEVDLNPLPRASSGAPADIRPGDPRALGAWSHAAPARRDRRMSPPPRFFSRRPDLSGPIPQEWSPAAGPAMSAMPRLISFTAGLHPLRHLVGVQGNSFTFVLEYEFENQILAELGYRLRWRELRGWACSRRHYFFLAESSDFFELSFASDLEELSDLEEESSDFDLLSFLEDESPFEEPAAEPVEDFLA